MKFCNLGIKRNVCSRKVYVRRVSTVLIIYGLPNGQLKGIPWNLGQFQRKPKICEQFDIFCRLMKSREIFPPHPLPRKKDSKKVSARPPHSHPTIADLHVTSRRPCWMKRTKAFLSSGNLTLFSCEFFKKKLYCIVVQHGRLVTWFQPRQAKAICRFSQG